MLLEERPTTPISISDLIIPHKGITADEMKKVVEEDKKIEQSQSRLKHHQEGIKQEFLGSLSAKDREAQKIIDDLIGIAHYYLRNDQRQINLLTIEPLFYLLRIEHINDPKRKEAEEWFKEKLEELRKEFFAEENAPIIDTENMRQVIITLSPNNDGSTIRIQRYDANGYSFFPGDSSYLLRYQRLDDTTGTAEVTIGRDRDNDIRAKKDSVSRFHVKVILARTWMKVVDRNSTYGIDVEVERYPVRTKEVATPSPSP